jgi:hypothetical protein
MQGRVQPSYLDHLRQKLHDRAASLTAHPRQR